MDSMNSGDYGLVVHEGHGFFYNMSVGNDNIVVSNADALINGPNYFVMYALNCSSAAFDVACLLERFIQNGNGGAVASVGAVRAAFPNAADDYQQSFFDHLYTQGTLPIGDALNGSRNNLFGGTTIETVNRWTQLCYTLLGDPALEMWRTTPRVGVFTHSNSIDQSDATLPVSITHEASPLPNAQVTVRQGAFYATGTTDITGAINVPLSGLSAGSLDLTINGAGLIPYAATITVTAGGPHITAVINAIDDDFGGGSLGNNDGIADAGETIEWILQYNNDGDGTGVTGLTATLTAVDAPGATITTGVAAVGDVSGGGNVIGSPFVVQLATGIPDGEPLHFQVSMNDGSNTWNQSLVLDVHAAQLEVVRVIVDDSASGNDDGRVQAGETFTLRLELKNYGSGATGTITGALSSGSGNVQILSAATTWPSIGTTATALDGGTLSVIENDVSGENEMQIDVFTQLGLIVSHPIELREPSPPNTPVPDTSLGADVIALRWDSDFQVHARGFRVYRGDTMVGPFSELTQDVLLQTGYYTDLNLPALTEFAYYVTAIDSSGYESDPSTIITATTSPAEIAGFPVPLTLEVSGDVAVGDVLGNGDLYAVVGSDLVYAIGGDGNELVDGDSDGSTFGPINPNGSQYSPSGITLADLDNDNKPEILASSWNTREFYIFDEDGTVLPNWPQLMANKSWGTPAVGDVDGDNMPEIVVNNVTGLTFVWNPDATEILDGDSDPGTIGVFHTRPGEGFNRTTPALYDLDGDGAREMIFGTYFLDGTSNKVHAFRFDGTEAPGWPKDLGPGGWVVSSPAVGDLDNDGNVEIVLPVDDNMLYVWNENGSNFTGFPIAFENNGGDLNSVTPSPALADFDGDNDLEIVAVSVVNGVQSFLHLMDHNGTPRPGWPVELPGLSESSPVIGDINGDSSLDIVWGIGGGSDTSPSAVYAFNSDGTLVQGFPIPVGAAPRGTPVLTDLDGDGDIDIVLAGLDRQIHAWDMPFPYDANRVPWPTFHGDMARTGVFNDGGATAVDPGAVPISKQLRIEGNVPNPFNPNTTIRFEIPDLSPGSDPNVRLDVFDVAGRRIRTLWQGPLAPGSHDLTWNGRDASGSTVGSGIYFARLNAGDLYTSLKMTLVK